MPRPVELVFAVTVKRPSALLKPMLPVSELSPNSALSAAETVRYCVPVPSASIVLAKLMSPLPVALDVRVVP